MGHCQFPRKILATVHGSVFLLPGHFRLSFAVAEDLLEEACCRIRRSCEGLR